MDYSNMDGKKMNRIKHGGSSEYYQYVKGQIYPPVKPATSAGELSIIAGAVCLLVTFAILAITILL